MNPLKIKEDLLTEDQANFQKTFGEVIYLDKKEVPDYQSIVVNDETGESLTSALIDEETGRIVEGSVPDGVTASIRRRPIEGTVMAYDLILDSEVYGGQIDVTVPADFPINRLVYNQVVNLKELTARHWHDSRRRETNRGTTYDFTHGFKLRATGLAENKNEPKPQVPTPKKEN